LFSLYRVGHVLSEQNIPIGCMHFQLAKLVIASMRACPEHRDLATNFNAILRALNNSSESIIGETEEAQQNRQEEEVNRRVLLQMLVAAVEMAVLSGPIEDSLLAEIVDGDLLECHHSMEVSGETGKKKNKNKKAASQSSSPRDDLTLALLRSLPDLMESFKTEPAIVRSLTTLPQYFCASSSSLLRYDMVRALLV
jgi:cohesin complex subunit SA-1/2